ncbi:MAG TPA: restriction endonuclease subunit S [Xanthomonadaceae bacterium]|nr:restriction endonuclease subunit S [Xanthomonadaceae bacterium]
MIDGLKPYPAMKDSGVPWLGEVPEHWEALPALAAYRPRQVKNTRMIETTVLSLSYGRIIVKPPEKLRGLVPESFETYQVVDPGNIIVRTTDLQNDQTSLRIGHSQHRGIITSAYMCLETTPRVSNEFGYQYLNAYDLLKIIYGFGSGLRQNLDFNDIKRMPVLVPPLPEQAAIVRFLDHADRRIRRYIRAKQKLITLLEEQKQAIIHRAVTRGLDPNVRLKPSGVEWLGDVPEHWEATRLKNVATVQTGITLGKGYRAAVTKRYPYLRVANVQTGRVDLRAVKGIDVPEADARRCMLRKGDVLMTEGGDIDKLGRGCVWDGQIADCLHQNHVFAVRCGPRLVPAFLVGLMASGHGRSYFQMTAKQTTNLAATNSTTLRAFPLFLPTVEDQERILSSIAEGTRELEAAGGNAAREIALLREYRTRLIADVVTGKLDVREAALLLPDEEPLRAFASSREPAPLDEIDTEGDTDEAGVDDTGTVPEEAEA